MSDAKRSIGERGASSLVEQVRRHPHVKALMKTLASGEKRAHLCGLRGTSAVFLIEALREPLGRVVVACCPDEEYARDILSDIRTVSSARAFHFPERDIFPQRFEMHGNLSVRGARNLCLDRILQNEADIVVTSILGFLEKTIPADTLKMHRWTVRLNETLDIDDFRKWLVEMGYECATVIEEIGQFAVRGSIVDLFDPSWERPARIELLDDEVLSIRSFDIDSQRSVEKIDAITVLPATGIPTGELSWRELRKRLECLQVDDAEIDRILGEITHVQRSYLLRRYAPALGMNGTLLDFFQSPPVLVFLGVEALERSLGAIEKEMEFLSKQPNNGRPHLDLYDYLNRPDYYESHDFQSVYVWDLPKEEGSRSASDSEASFTPVRSGEQMFRFQTASHPSIIGKIDVLTKMIRRLRSKGIDVHIYSESAAQRERLADMLDEAEELVHLPVGWITSGFLWEEAGLAVLTDHEIFNRILPRPRKAARRRRVHGLHYDQLQLGDFVVHVDYGIGRFTGLEKVRVDGRETECLTIRYLGGDRIFVPLDQMHLVEKYIGKEGAVPTIDRLGSTRWQRTKERTKKVLEDVARELLEIYAAREIARGNAFSPDTPWQKELEAAFPFEETPHQLAATNDTKRDMESDIPMDRLICGDVGYGKTEVAIRAAFKAVNDGKQVAVLVPTTILAMQHFKTFRDRMEAFPVVVEMLSRFRSQAEQKRIVNSLAKGTIEVVIGTHRLLSKDIAFKNLGLVIIDEEHRFGVRSKEKLKRLKESVDVLSLTATPIPRTLYMALSGFRRISVIDTPPRNRHPIKTEIIPFDEEAIARAIMNEVNRGGQVFFVHNRVASIYSMQAFLERLLPGVRFGVAHGQMMERELERKVLSFLDREFDVLISTMIIESGLDFPNVDTIVINRADRFGLAQLYQLRGRVGRRERQAYAYMLLPRYVSLNENARKRLQAMEEFEELGSGYRLAMRDLEIRGAGNVLGIEQHGHMMAVGFDLYYKMLREAVEVLQGKPKRAAAECRLEVGIKSFLPDWYVEDQDERMALYKRLASVGMTDELDAIEEEIIDRFGTLPPEARNLIDLARIKLQAELLGVNRIRIKRNKVVLGFSEGRALSPRQCAHLVETHHDALLFKSGRVFSAILDLGESGRGREGVALGLEEGGSADERVWESGRLKPDERILEEVKNLLKLAYDSDKSEI